MSTSAKNDISNCTDKLTEIFNYLDPSLMENDCTFELYLPWKKELTKKLKEWDVAYVKHAKNTFPEMNDKVHMVAMKPLTNLINANLNFTNLEKMIAKDKKSVPEFRHKALEEEFCKFLTEVCDIFKEYG
jgi:hypothetical protein